MQNALCQKFAPKIFTGWNPAFAGTASSSINMSETKSWPFLNWKKTGKDNAVQAAVTIQSRLLVNYNEGRKKEPSPTAMQGSSVKPRALRS